MAAPLLLLAPVSAAPQPATEKVVLAGGCFWGMQAVFSDLRGVKSVVAGYSGGAAETAHYDIVSTGTTGHAESVQIEYDPAKITFGQLLSVYFLVAHDPTQLDRQGPDFGTQYRSAVFYTTDAQKRETESYISALEAQKSFDGKIVTQVVPLRAFYPAEDYHQNYVAHNPDNPYVMYNDLPKLAALRHQFPSLVKS
ncbi:MAG TPA: peptide-methionine (S)-S-oxide reductase MsrA [Candidatus Eremiobacteraceae bacterium]|nr:peptide-methionine (S)-S-oxide reductase MsrA [Candidatus Eremiobacteraceae bacterium]